MLPAFCYIMNVINYKEKEMKKSFAVDPRFFLMVFCTLVAALFTAAGVSEGDALPALTIGGLLTLLFAFGSVIIPKLYVADEKGISIYYLPFVKEYFKWNEIKRIKIKKSYSRSIIFDFLWKEYEIIPIKEKRYKGSKYHSIFHSSEISRTFLTRRMIKKYWDGNIEDDSFSWFKKHFSKEKDKTVRYDLTEVKQKEKSARDMLKQTVSQYESKATLYGKTIDASCTYFTDDEDLGSRPKENYSYVAEIFVEKENDEDNSFYITVELLFVSYGKKSVKITENKKAFDEIADRLNEAIEKAGNNV